MPGTYSIAEEHWTYSGWPYKKDFVWSVLSKYDDRSSPSSTKPLPSGEYYLPTSYRSVHTRVDSLPFSVKGYSQPQGFPVKTSVWGRKKHDSWYPANSGLFHGCFNTWPHWPNVPAVVDLQLREKLAAKALGQDFNLGQSLGELPETVRMIADLGLAALRLVRGLRRGRVDFPNLLDRKIGALAGDYLTFQYGIKPLINETYGLLRTISDGLQEKNIFMVKAVVYDTSFRAPVAHSSYPYVQASGTFKRGIKGQYVFSVRDPLLFDLDRLGLLNPYALAWELFPLSFVIDWFLHIGSFLQGLSLPIALKFEHGFFTEFVNTTWEAIDLDPNWGGERPRIIFRNKAMSRVPKWDFPFPLPYFNPDLNLSKVASMVALALATKRGK